MNIVIFFPSLGFMPVGFTNKVLMRHLLNGSYSRGSVVNKGFIHVVNDHIHETNNQLNENE